MNDNQLIESRLAELQAIVAQLRNENSELNRRLSAQNRPGKQLADAIKVATIILSEHINGQPTGRQAIRRKYEDLGRRRWGWGVALLKLCYVVVDSSNWALSFNSNLSITRAYEKLQLASTELANDPKPIDRLRPYLPSWQR